MHHRILNLKQLIQHRSLFLLGPRQTGKSTLLRHLFPKAKYIDLLEADTFREFSAHPEYLRQRLTPQDHLIILDEIQKLPSLLDEVQALMTRVPKLRFILTGSSARKLKRGGANLLGGRAWVCNFHPLVFPEFKKFNLLRSLNVGGLPSIYDSPYPEEDLKAYVGTYLREEIQAEGLTRKIENFSRFLQVAGLTNGEQLNFTAVASDVGMPVRTVQEHYKILEDTLVGFLLPAYQKTLKRKPVATSKFFFFDVGVANFLMKRGKVELGSESFGRALEHFVFLELRAYLDYRRSNLELSYWRSRSQFEVDFLVGDEIAIEVKGKSHVSSRDYRGILALDEEKKLKRKIVVCMESHPRRTEEGVEILPVQEFLKLLWRDEIIAG